MLKSQLKMVAMLVGAVAVLGLLLGPTFAALTPIERFNDYSTTFDNPNNFANAMAHISIRQTWQADAIGDISNQTFPLALGYYNLQWIGDANIGVSNVVLNPASVSADITALAGVTGVTYMTADTKASNGFPIVGVSGGSYFLQESFMSIGGVGDHHPFIWQMVLPGDWSVKGTGFGEHELLNINPLWTIVNDFTFDGTKTTFRAQLDDYINDGQHNIAIVFRLHGAPVPLSPSVWLFGSGLVGLIGLRSFRKN